MNFEESINATFADIARDFLTQVTAELDPYTSEKGIIEINLDTNEATLISPAHIQFAKYGRGPGKQPPHDNILKWVQEKRFQFRGKKGRFVSYNSTAWIIAKHIAENGTNNWLPNAPNAIEEAIGMHKDSYVDKLSKSLNSVIQLSIADAFRAGSGEIEYKI